MEKSFYTVAEIIEITGLGRTKIYEEINSNALKAKKCGTRTLIEAASFEQWKNSLPTYQGNTNA